MRKTVLTLSLAMLLLATLVAPVKASAAVTDSTAGVQYETTLYDCTLTSDTKSCDVEASVGSSFCVTIPKKITLGSTGDAKGKGVYSIIVDADLSGTEQVTVVPAAKAEGFVLKEAGGKADIDYTVSQTYTIFIASGSTTTGSAAEKYLSADAIEGYTTVNCETAKVEGTIVASQISAGSWSGAFDFNIAMAEKQN